MCDGQGRPVILLLSEGQMSDHRGAALMLASLPRAKELLGDKGYDSNRFRDTLTERGIIPCIPSSKSRKVPLPYDKALYRQRHRIENMFGRLKDWRRIAMRYDRCAHTFMSAICLAAAVLFWINESRPQALLPDVPPLAETLPGFDAVFWQGLFVPVGTPEWVIARLSEALRTATEDPELRAAMAAQGVAAETGDAATLRRLLVDTLRCGGS